jgi:hypothetical protein
MMMIMMMIKKIIVLTIQAHGVVLLCLQRFPVDDRVHPGEVCYSTGVYVAIYNKDSV